MELSFQGDPILGSVISQWLHPSADHKNDFGIKTVYDDNMEMYIEYDDSNVIMSQYLKNQPPGMLPVPEQQDFSLTSPTKRISVKDIVGQLRQRDRKTPNKINEVHMDLKKAWDETMRGGAYEFTEWKDFEDRVYNGYFSTLYDTDEDGDRSDIHEFSISDQFLLGENANIRNALKSDMSFINQLKYEDLGLDTRLDSNYDGIIQEEEFLNEADKNVLIDAIINPKTNEQRKHSAQTIAWFLTRRTQQQFEGRRKQQNPKEKDANYYKNLIK